VSIPPFAKRRRDVYSLDLESFPHELWARLRELHPIERAVYVLHRWFAYSHREIANALCIAESDARRAFHHARERLEG
jgi:DNA-directed RNA polymerase specialized sigma24 family protein